MKVMECCPECKSKNLSPDSSRGEVYCKDCGLVVEEQIEAEHNYNKKIFFHSRDPIRKKESRHQTKSDKEDIRKRELENKIEFYCDSLSLCPFKKETESIIMKMFRKRQLIGVSYDITILAVILHLCLRKDSKSDENVKDSLKSTKENIKKTLSIIKKNTDRSNYSEISQPAEEVYKGVRNINIDIKNLISEKKTYLKVLNFLPNTKNKILSRLRKLYSNKILPINQSHLLFSLREVEFLDKHFLKAFEKEKEFLDLLKCKSKSNKKKIIKLRNNTPKYALRCVYEMKISEERGEKISSPNWKGLFCTCFYYLMKDYFKEEFKENCPSQEKFIKFFGVGKKNFIYYLNFFRRQRLSKKIFEDKENLFELKCLYR